MGRAVRRRGDKLPIIMFSTLTERGASVVLDALAAGASDYVAKSATVGSLAEPIAGGGRPARVWSPELAPASSGFADHLRQPEQSGNGRTSVVREGDRLPVFGTGR